MAIWFLITLIIVLFRRGRPSFASGILVSAYFSVVFVLAKISTVFFPLYGDEPLYDRCGVVYSDLISKGYLWNFPESACSVADTNYFAKLVGYIYYLCGANFFSLIGFNAFLMYFACEICLNSFPISAERKERLFKIVLFLPPLLYLSIRPAKEAIVTFLISAIFYSVTHSKRAYRWVLTGLLFFIFFRIRWQFAVVTFMATGLFVSWHFLTLLKNPMKVKVLIGAFCVLAGTWLMVGERVTTVLYKSYFSSNSAEAYDAKEDGALIYKVMRTRDEVKCLYWWNLIVAHVGGFFVPHPLRFLREYIRDWKFKYNVFEEFLYVSFWFYSLLPVFALYFKKRFFDKIKAIDQIEKHEVFKLILSASLFSLACFTLFYQAPQLFRYKIPLNIYLFVTIAVYVQELGVDQLKALLKEHSLALRYYGYFLFLYSGVYLLWW